MRIRKTADIFFFNEISIQGGQKLLSPPAISLLIEETINRLMSDDVAFSPVRNDPLKAFHPIEEDALELVECHSILDQCNSLHNFFNRLECAILHVSLQHSKEPKVARTQIWRIIWMEKLFKLCI
jgi:hypothetical protein